MLNSLFQLNIEVVDFLISVGRIGYLLMWVRLCPENARAMIFFDISSNGSSST